MTATRPGAKPQYGVIVPGEKLWVSLDGVNDLIGFALSGQKHIEGYDGLKVEVQVGATVHVVGYREPADRDSGGKGRTCWKAK